MRSLFFLVAVLASPAPAAADAAKSVVIRDWSINVPSDTEVHKSEGPDFSVTYFAQPKSNSQFGIYEGGHPQEYAAKQPSVTKQKDRIGGQDVVWSLWKERAEGRDVMRAELIMVCAVTKIPNRDVAYEEKFHIFLSAADEKGRAALQEVVRTLTKKNA